jgi:hypothetical protein
MTKEEIGLAVVETWSNGGRISDVIKAAGLSIGGFYSILNRYSKVQVAYDQARKIKADRYADEVVAVSDEELDPQRARVKIDARKWVASVYNRALYGDKVDLNLTGALDLRAALTQRQREVLRLPGDSDLIEDAQAIESQRPLAIEMTDAQSVIAEELAASENPFND